MEVSEGAQSVGRAAQSLRSLFPDLEMNHISLLGKGWDSVAYLVNDNIVVRVPRRPAVGRQMEKEVRVLEAIRPYVSVRLPFIEWVGQPQGEFTVSAIGYRKLSGTPLSAIEPGSARDNALRQVGPISQRPSRHPNECAEQGECALVSMDGRQQCRRSRRLGKRTAKLHGSHHTTGCSLAGYRIGDEGHP